MTWRRVAALGIVAAVLTGCGATIAPAPEAAAPPSSPTVEVEPAVLAAVLAASQPERLRVPAIGVDSDLMDLGLQADGTLEVPPDGLLAGWFTGSPTPGERGPAVLAGHVDWGGSLGVFASLRDVAVGDRVLVDRADGGTAEFVVTQIDQVAKQDFPTAQVYGDLDHAGLRLITCGGDFDAATGNYLDDIVVYADLLT